MKKDCEQGKKVSQRIEGSVDSDAASKFINELRESLLAGNKCT